MRGDKNRALKFRLAGKSYNEISALLGIPKSTLSGWFTNLVLSTKAQERLKGRVHVGSLKGLVNRNKNQTHLARQRMFTLRGLGKNEIRRIDKERLQVIGVALYWAEGYKRAIIRNGKPVTHHAVALTNSDPKLILIFLRFLREVCNVANESIKADIRIYEHMNEAWLLKFWRKTTNLPEQNFGKVYYGVSKSSLGKRPFNRLPYGTLSIRVNNTNLFHRIMGMIEGLSEQCP